jgi:Tfp pilus assembly protein PilF
MTLRFAICVLLLCGVASGCKTRPSPSADAKPEYQTIGKDPRRDTDTAKAENATALQLMNKGDWSAAEAALKRALSADIMFGPAHNHLGKIYYRQNKLYLAAWEFEYAAKLMPHQAEPKNNMGLVFEAAGKWNEAVDSYDQALVLEPENSEVIGNAARARLRRGDAGPEVRVLLSKLVLTDSRPEWVDWARKRLVMIPETSITAPTTQP